MGFKPNYSHIKDERIKFALDYIYETYGHTCRLISPYTKFGRRTDVGITSDSIMTLPTGVAHETLLSDNLITQVSSSSAADNQTITVEGHQVINVAGDLLFYSQEVTLNGRNAVSLDTPMARIDRAYNNDSTELAGDVYFAETDTLTLGVPNTSSKVHCIIPAGEQQTFKLGFNVCYDKYFIGTQFGLAVNKKTAASVDSRLEIRLPNKVYRPNIITAVASTGSNTGLVNLDPCIVVPRNADIRGVAIASTANVDVSAFLGGYVAQILDDLT